MINKGNEWIQAFEIGIFVPQYQDLESKGLVHPTIDTAFKYDTLMVPKVKMISITSLTPVDLFW